MGSRTAKGQGQGQQEKAKGEQQDKARVKGSRTVKRKRCKKWQACKK